MDQRLLFIADCARDLDPIAEVCRRFGVSRKTGYKWITRFKQHGLEGLAERPRQPLRCPSAIPTDIAQVLLEARRHHPTWGPKKLLALLARHHPEGKGPAVSTVCRLLKQNGLITSPRRRRRIGHPGRPLTPMTQPNEIWTADFKGHFKTSNGLYCYPLTVTDGFSRFIFDVSAFLSPSHELTKPVLERLFREYGLPKIIRTDNGAPFATTAIGRLSRCCLSGKSVIPPLRRSGLRH